MRSNILPLFAQPAEPTPSQLAAERRLNPLILKAHEAVLASVNSWHAMGATASKVAEETGLTLNTVRARLTEGTDTLYVRLAAMREREHIYVCKEYYRKTHGPAIPRRRHRGQR